MKTCSKLDHTQAYHCLPHLFVDNWAKACSKKKHVSTKNLLSPLAPNGEVDSEAGDTDDCNAGGIDSIG